MEFPKLTIIELNEINFSIVKKYISSSKIKLPNFKKLINDYNFIETHSEKDYELLEPWIQWTSAHTGKDYNEHKIFRLGDSKYKQPSYNQIFEKLENNGEYVGAIAPMNALNKLNRPAYFIPDAWTQTNSDETNFSKKITQMVQQTINDNSKNKLDLKSIMTLVEIIIRSFNIKITPYLIKNILKGIFNRSLRSLVFDNILHVLHCYLIQKKKPTVSFCFFNAGAHIQHHYFFNSPYAGGTNHNPTWYIKKNLDPIKDMLIFYDNVLKYYLDKVDKGGKLIVSTGLSQKPYDKVKYYYRLKDHHNFIKKIGIDFDDIFPRMTRDFEITFSDHNSQKKALVTLQSIIMDKDSTRIFEHIEVRKTSLFVTLSYPNEINKFSKVKNINNNTYFNFFDDVSFVAIKNGMHDSKGYLYFSKNINYPIPDDSIHIKNMYNITLDALKK